LKPRKKKKTRVNYPTAFSAKNPFQLLLFGPQKAELPDLDMPSSSDKEFRLNWDFRGEKRPLRDGKFHVVVFSASFFGEHHLFQTKKTCPERALRF